MKSRLQRSTGNRFLIDPQRKLPMWRLMALTLVLFCAIAAGIGFVGEPPVASREDTPIPAVEFSRVFKEFSEPDGYFRSDNFVSNETSYLHVMDLLQELSVEGGAYIGVGPEQNFTYISKIRPKLAFLIDIRRQAILQHLMYKGLFHLAESRRDFLSLLLSRTVDADAPAPNAPVGDLVTYFWGRPPDKPLFEDSFQKLLTHIQRDSHAPLSNRDVAGLHYVFSSFRDYGLDIRYRTGGGGSYRYGYSSYWGGGFPNLAEILLDTNLNGVESGFLASDESFLFVKNLHRQNRILMAVGDFAGPKALKSIGNYLKKNRLKVSAFYVSNVEQYLYQYNVFEHFAENVKALPIDEQSVFIRAVAGRRMQHPANVPGHRLTTMLQRMSSFVNGFNGGKLADYWDLVNFEYLAPVSRPAGRNPR